MSRGEESVKWREEVFALADDAPAAATAVIPRPDAAEEQDDDEQEKQKGEHEGSVPQTPPAEP
jgi:hypothetical protein